MYDSGGINLKPGDAMHLPMKHDMAGAGAILGAMSAMAALECPTTVTGYLMCTDNMPSGSAMKMGDVLPSAAARQSRSITPTPRAAWSWPTRWCCATKTTT